MFNKFKYLIIVFAIFSISSCSTSLNRSPANIFDFLRNRLGRTSQTSNHEIKFGIEMTFTNKEIINARIRTLADPFQTQTDENTHFQNLLIARIMDNCEGCILEESHNSTNYPVGKIIYPDGWYMEVTLDPGVVEVVAKPIPESDVEMIAERLDQDLFSHAREVGLFPSESRGGGHLHLGAKEFFEDNPLLFRDFVVDMFNHSELGEGILANTNDNSPVIKSFPKEIQEKFISIIKEFDEYPTDIFTLAMRIRDEVYSYHPKDGRWQRFSEKFQAFNLERLVVEGFEEHEKTVEIRAIRPQQNAEQFILLTRLFSKRRDFLKRAREEGSPIELVESRPKTKTEKITAYIKYLDEMGENPEDYLRLLPGDYVSEAWKEMRRLYPNSHIDRKLIFIRDLAVDMPFDDLSKGQAAAQYLAELKNKSYDDFFAQKELVTEILDVLQKTFTKSRSLKEIRRELNKLYPEQARDCRQVTRRLAS